MEVESLSDSLRWIKQSWSYNLHIVPIPILFQRPVLIFVVVVVFFLPLSL